MQTPFTQVPDWFPWENAGASIAVADVDADGRPDVVLLMVDAPPGRNAAFYRIGRALDESGALTGGWTDWQPVPDWFSDENQGAGVAVADVNGNGALDLVVFLLDAPDGPNLGWFRVGWSLDPATGSVTGGWTDWQLIPDWFPLANAGGDITVADVDGDGRPDLVVLMVDAPEGPNAAYYRSGPLDADGTVTHWRPWQALPDWPFWENQGAGLAVADLDGDGHAELVVLAVDNPVAKNEAFYSVGWHLDERGRPGDGWGPWTKIPDWDFWENQGCGLAITPLGAAGEPHLVVVAVDAPVGQNAAFHRVLDAMTDLEMAPEMGVWRLLEDGSGTLAVHAALLHTGDLLFFAGSSNDPDRHNAHQFGTTVWRYPGAEQQQPDTPVDLFCVGHAFLPDGRLLAAGGTQQYDPFFGLTQSIAFDPATRTWVPQPQMAGGRWYPSLLALGDGRVLATSGLDGTSQLNLVPEIYTDGAGWATRPQSQNWPMYGHLFLLADGRVFYSGGQYGDNNGVRPAVWNLTTNATADVPGLPDPGSRNQSASVLLPPAQAQQVMIIGGGPYDMHNQAGATAATAVADLTAAAPTYIAHGRPAHGPHAPVRDAAAGPHRAGQRRRDDGGDGRAGGVRRRDLPPGGGGVAHGGRQPGAPALPLGRRAPAGWQGRDGGVEPAAQDRGDARRGLLAALPVRGAPAVGGARAAGGDLRGGADGDGAGRGGRRERRADATGGHHALQRPGAAAGRPAADRHRSGHPRADAPGVTEPGAARLVPAHGARRGGKAVARGVGPPEVRGDETR